MGGHFVLRKNNYRTWPLLPTDFACTDERSNTDMKTVMRSNMYLPVAAMILASAFAAPAAAQTLVPFKGAMQGMNVDSAGPSPGTIVETPTGTGVATHLGQFSYTEVITVNLATFTGAGTARWVAANGDSIDTTLVGSAEPTATPGVVSITEVHTITGGTGRFAGAQGSFTVERLINAVTQLTSGSFHGTITSPGAVH
jgi:hypothetical protein